MEKRRWESSAARYADFWDARAVLEKLQKIPLDWKNVQAVRDRCIIVLRSLHLRRSIDLAMALRAQSKLAGNLYWLLKRKRGQTAWVGSTAVASVAFCFSFAFSERICGHDGVPRQEWGPGVPFCHTPFCSFNGK